MDEQEEMHRQIPTIPSIRLKRKVRQDRPDEPRPAPFRLYQPVVEVGSAVLRRGEAACGVAAPRQWPRIACVAAPCIRPRRARKPTHRTSTTDC